jgi:hypothetical protein
MERSRSQRLSTVASSCVEEVAVFLEDEGEARMSKRKTGFRSTLEVTAEAMDGLLAPNEQTHQNKQTKGSYGHQIECPRG